MLSRAHKEAMRRRLEEEKLKIDIKEFEKLKKEEKKKKKRRKTNIK